MLPSLLQGQRSIHMTPTGLVVYFEMVGLFFLRLSGFFYLLEAISAKHARLVSNQPNVASAFCSLFWPLFQFRQPRRPRRAKPR